METTLLAAGPSMVLTLSLVVPAVVVSAVLLRIARADRREEQWERDLIERAFAPDDPTDPDPTDDGPTDDEENRS